MNSDRVLYFLSLLGSGSPERRGELSAMLQEALDSNDVVIRAKTLDNDSILFGEIGKNIRKALGNLLRKVYDNPSEAVETLPYLRQVCETFEKYRQVSEEKLLSPVPLHFDVIALTRKKELPMMIAFRRIAAACVWMTAVYAGAEMLKRLAWSDNAGLIDYSSRLNSLFLPTLMEVRRPEYCWVITRDHAPRSALFRMDQFRLEYRPADRMEMLCGAYPCRAISHGVFLNTDAYEKQEYFVPYCWGVGNIVSSSPENALQLLAEGEIITWLRPPTQSETGRKLPQPMALLDTLGEGKAFCVAPEELVRAMNQWQQGHQLYVGRIGRTCLFCGKRLAGNTLVCPDHFENTVLG